MNSPAQFLQSYPEAMSQWHPTKNSHLTGMVLTPTSTIKAWWLGECGHEWETQIGLRTTRNSACPYCARRKVLTGFNDLKTTHPGLADEWQESPANAPYSPSTIMSGARFKATWVCREGHEWVSPVKTRTKATTVCPYCSGRKVLPGVNDFKTKYPQLAVQWSQNNDTPPHSYTPGSDKKALWVCGEGHEWEAKINARVSGRGCPVCSGQKVLPTHNDLNTTHNFLVNEWNWVKNGILKPSQVTAGSPTRVWWVCEKKHEWETRICDRTTRLRSCPECNATTYVSHPEKIIVQFLEELGFTPLTSVRKIISPYELDIYIPEKKIAVEFNGLYWHSEAAGKDKTYHYNKWLACKNQGIQLIQIWEDDWNRNPDLIKQMLAHKLKSNSDKKIYARTTQVIEIDSQHANTFLTKHHIQGAVDGSVKLGLMSPDGNISAVMVLKIEPKTKGKSLNLLRYATALPIPGGFTKLLAYVEKAYSPYQIVTFSDNCVSDGLLYKENGFVVEKQLPPDYMYVVGGERKHKFGYRLKKFKNSPNLQYVEGLTEKELAKLNNIPRIWDAGKTKWVKSKFS